MEIKDDDFTQPDRNNWFVLSLIIVCCCSLSVAIYSLIVSVDRENLISRVDHLFIGPSRKLSRGTRLFQVKVFNPQEIQVFPYTYRKQPLPQTAQDMIKHVERSINDPAYKAKLINYKYNPYGEIYNDEIEDKLLGWEESFSPIVGVTPYSTKYFDVWLFKGSKGLYYIDYYSSKGAILDNKEDVINPAVLYDRVLKQMTESYNKGYFNTEPQYLETDKILFSRYFVLSHIRRGTETIYERPTSNSSTSLKDYSTVFLSYSQDVFEVIAKEKEKTRLLHLCLLGGLIMSGFLGMTFHKRRKQ